MLWLNFFDQFLKLWAVILERRNIFSKKFLAQIIIFDKYFGWFDVQLNQKILVDLYCTVGALTKNHKMKNDPYQILQPP